MAESDKTPVEIDSLLKGYFKFENGDRLEIDPALLLASEVVKKAAEENKNDKEFEVPVDSEIDLPELEFLNEFMRLAREKFDSKLRTDGTKKDPWFDFVPQNISILEPLAKKTDKNLLIGGANAGDILEVPSFVSFCVYFLVIRTKGLNLEGMRNFLNEENDFTDEQKRIIAECPELNDL